MNTNNLPSFEPPILTAGAAGVSPSPVASFILRAVGAILGATIFAEILLNR